MIRKLISIFSLSLSAQLIYAQVKIDSIPIPKDPLQYLSSPLVCPSGVPTIKRQWIVGGSNALLWAGSFIALNKAWYTDYDRGSFHFFNDNKEWQQVDKIGHVWTSYQISRVSTQAWRWTGIKNRKSILLGAVSGIAYQTIIEIQDGYSDKWGFSIGDMGANFIGSGIYAFQELKWKEQRVAIKFSYWPYDYNNGLTERRNQLFGKSFMERILKDYNGQAYWLSGNIASFFPGSRWPSWLNLAVGYRGSGMLGGKENIWIDNQGNEKQRKDILRTRHFYLSPDIDFSKIPTHRKLVKKFFFILNAVKIPAPAVGVDARGRVSFHALAY